MAEKTPQHGPTFLRDACKAIDALLPDNHGFVLLVAPLTAQPGPNDYVRYAASVQRGDAANMLKDLLKHWGQL